MLADVDARLADRRLALYVAPAALTSIVERGSDPAYGARPLRRFIQRELETRIARRLLAGDVEDGSRIMVGLDEQGELEVRIISPVRASDTAA